MTFSSITRLWLAAIAVCLALAGRVDAQQVQYSHGNPTALEQQMLEYINRARANPSQEGIFLDTIDTWYSRDARIRKPSFFANLRAEFAAFPAVQPLAFHPELIDAARAHSQDMVARNYLAHVNQSGQTPTMRGAAAGYDTGVGENIDGGGASSGGDVLHSHYAFMVDYDNLDTANPLGHRYNVMTAGYTEVGIGISGPRYGGRITQDFGSPARSYIVGVAYNDTNGNGRYDAGEALAGVTVRPDVGNWFAVTSNSGGFAIPIDPVQTVSDTVNVPFPVQGSSWASVQPYDAAYRQQQLAAAPNITVNLTWSGGTLASPIGTRVTMKRPVLRNYRLMGTDSWFYSMSMVTTQNAKADLAGNVPVRFVPGTKDLNRDGFSDLIFQNSAGQIASWFLNGTASPVDFSSGAGVVPGSKVINSGGLGDWKLCAKADVNSDGVLDLIFQNTGGQIYVWLLDGSGNAVDFNSGTGLKPGSKFLYSIGLGDWRLADAADLNGDGSADLVLQNGAGQIYVWFLDGSGNGINFATGAGLKPGWKFIYSGALSDWRLANCADINSDGKSDLIFQNKAGQIYTWLLDGSGNAVDFATGTGLVPGSSMLYSPGLGDWKLVACSDLNNDGAGDLIFQNKVGQIGAWTLDGSGTAVNFATGVGLRLGSVMLYSGAVGDWKVR